MAKKATKKTTKKATTKSTPAKKSGVIAASSTNPVIEDTSSSKRSLKKPQTLREKAEKASAPRKPRRVNRAGSTAAKPFKLIGRLIVKLLRPLRFLLWPFKRRPVRFVGRLLYKILLIGYFRGAWSEVRQVVWPNRKETAKLTVAVFTFALIFTLIITVVDYGLDKVFKALFLK